MICSAVRGMIQAGIPDVVAMKNSGHKTRAIFDRYHIVSQRDLEAAARKLEEAASFTLDAQSDEEEGPTVVN